MDSISPLAKILAEANGIDWRAIQGTGEGDSIVEQDILNYLSRVMSGEEDAPLTPVDEAPPGWTGEMPPMPVPVSGLAALSAAGVESDITDFVKQQAQGSTAQMEAAQTVAAQTVAHPAHQAGQIEEPLSPLSADEFEIEEVAAPEAEPELEFELDDLESEHDDGRAAHQAELPAAVVYSEEPAFHEPLAAAIHENAIPDTINAEFAAPTQPVIGQPVIEEPSAAQPVSDQVAGVAKAAGAFGLGGFLSRLYGSKGSPVKDAEIHPEPATGSAHSEPVRSEPARAEPPHSEPVAAEHPASDHGLGEPLISQAPPISDTPVAAPLVADQWRDSEVAAHEPVVHAPAPAEPVHAETAQVEQAQPPVPHAPAVQVPAAQVPAVQTAATQAGAGAHAVTLRLNVDLKVLEVARAQLSEALFREVPLSLLVARAAARSMGTLGLDAGTGVALANHAGQPLAADLSGDFRSSLDGLKQITHADSVLLVLDAAELGLDELHRGERSLSVGRALDHGAALSLHGELDPVRGAQFLHEVAGLLGTPIRLLF